MGLAFVFLILGASFLIFGSHLLVTSLKSISLYFKLKPLFLSIVVLGFVSSAPEWFVTLTASFKNQSSAALGNVLGSNVINILLVLSIAGLFYRFSWNRQIARFDMPFLIASSLVLLAFFIDQKLLFLEACLLLLIFCAYLILLFKKRKNEEQQEIITKKDFSYLKTSTALIIGFAFLFVGSSLMVDSSLHIVKALSLSERFAGVFILSFSTSLPELAASLQAAFKKEEEMAVGNIIGSNIFNTLFVLGSAGVLNPLSFSQEFYYDYFFMLLVTVILWMALLFFKQISKVIFVLFMICYFAYIAFVSGLW